jgi:predicted enzyme related to lactoylglutathione lyase
LLSGFDAVTLFSENATKLAKFYKEKVGLKSTGEFVMGEGKSQANVYMFEFTKTSDFGIIDHSKIKGKNKNPERYLINFEVDDIKKEVSRLKKAKVKVITDIYHVEGYGWIATFVDVDGNFFQFVQVRAS